MIWKSKYVNPEIQNGATRIKRVFAWMPTYISGNMVWLQSYDVLQVYRITAYVVQFEGEQKEFAVGQWINLAKR